MCFFIKLGRNVSHGKRINPIDFGGQMSKVKVTMGIYGNKRVNTIETKPTMYIFTKFGRHVNHGERMDPIDFLSQRSRLQCWLDIKWSID